MERVRDLLDAVPATLDGSDSLVGRLSARRPSTGSTSANIAAEDFSSDLQIRETSAGCEVVGLTAIEVKSPADVRRIIAMGTDRRAVGTHSLNEHSSRSHMVIRLHVDGTVDHGVGKARLTASGSGAAAVMKVQSVLNLVDLAGSERVLRTEVSGQRLKEAQSINKSLSALGDVIAAHKNGLSHVPYRNSKLTFLLKDSLGGDAKVLMFVNVSGDTENVSESFYSLTFASRCRATALGEARKNVTALRKPSPTAAGSAGASGRGPSPKFGGGAGGPGAPRAITLSSSRSIAGMSEASTDYGDGDGDESDDSGADSPRSEMTPSMYSFTDAGSVRSTGDSVGGGSGRGPRGFGSSTSRSLSASGTRRASGSGTGLMPSALGRPPLGANSSLRF